MTRSLMHGRNSSTLNLLRKRQMKVSVPCVILTSLTIAHCETSVALARSRRAVQDAQEQISALELEAAQEHKAAKAKMKAVSASFS